MVAKSPHSACVRGAWRAVLGGQISPLEEICHATNGQWYTLLADTPSLPPRAK